MQPSETPTDDGGYDFINSHFDIGYYFDRPSEQRAARERLAAVCAELVSLRGQLEAATEYCDKIIAANQDAPGQLAAFRVALSNRFLAALGVQR